MMRHTTDCKPFEEEVILVDETTEFVKLSTVEVFVVCQNLHGVVCTSPYIDRADDCLLHSNERRLVFPAPEGPIMASISPGRQYPEQFSSTVLSLACAVRFSQVREIILVFFIYYNMMSYTSTLYYYIREMIRKVKEV
jgi:hypothetical protein